MATSRVAPGVGSTKKEFHLQKYINILSNGVLLCSTLTICCDVTVFSRSFLDLMAIALVFVWTGEYCLEKRMATRRVAVADLTLINFPAQSFVKWDQPKKNFSWKSLLVSGVYCCTALCVALCFFGVSGGGHPRSFVYLKPIAAFGILLTGFCINRKYQWPRLKATQTSAAPPQRLTTFEPNKPQNGERQNAPSKSDYLRTQEGTTLEHTLLGESGRPPSQYWQQLRTDSWETHVEYMDVDTEEYYSRPAREVSTFHEKLYCLDSGACTHTSDPSNPRSYYHAYPNYEPPIKSIYGFTGAAIPVEGCGYIDKGIIRGLHCVLSVPRSIANVVSIGQLTRQYRVKVTPSFIQKMFGSRGSIMGLGSGKAIGSMKPISTCCVLSSNRLTLL